MKSNKALSIMHTAIKDLIAIALHAIFAWVIWWFITNPMGFTSVTPEQVAVGYILLIIASALIKI